MPSDAWHAAGAGPVLGFLRGFSAGTPRDTTCVAVLRKAPPAPWLPAAVHGQAIVAVVVPVAGIGPDPEELREHVRSALRGSRTPDRVVFRDELPTNATGKVLRREIREMLAGRDDEK